MLPLRWLCLAVAFVTGGAHAVTVYQAPLGGLTPTSVAPNAVYTGAAAYDPTVLTAPPIPDPAPPTQFGVQLSNNAGNVSALTISPGGAFLGFSIEMSVVDQVLGLNGSRLQVPFLNLMTLVAERSGSVHIRVGGNTQEDAALVQSLPQNKIMEKQAVNANDPTQTPSLLYTPELLYLLSNISSLIDVKWYLGLPLNDTSNLRLAIAEYGESILGGNLLGLQVGNEPDLYARHGLRQSTYGPNDYFGEFAQVVQAMQADSNVKVNNNLIAPSVATGDWTPEDVWNTGFIDTYEASLSALAVEHYPDDNCAAIYGSAFGQLRDPQTVFPDYLNHTSALSIIAPYVNSTHVASAAGKPFIMFETNSASCGGFPGVSDSFGATLWLADYAMSMAAAGFSSALVHVGGQDVYYNPFTPPPTNQSSYHQWTIGSTFYAVLAIAEALGPISSSSTSNFQVIDLGANGGNEYTPGYAVYEGGTLARAVFINFMTDPSGANDLQVNLQVEEGVPANVQVKYLQSPSVGEHFNITWAGQTLGGQFASDGRLQGAQTIQTVACDTSANTCSITVPAPGLALVSFESSSSASYPTHTFATTATGATSTKVDPSVVATSNGSQGGGSHVGSTSRGKSQTSRGTTGVAPSLVMLAAMVLGAWMLGRTYAWRWP
ncbi:glycoside hydrolase family 79 protein [Rhodofomes roseus]|uniref:Glycoside hydrolase family 79 protein n=1 Tax=Rhodofomes roseus TaxID=34475 RepID=A0ABQ8KAG7_9APHY|nr:glycoside hydrolase family 79 protein [Rhodofomes roseus]KAH9834480.1 glycoside hydrolase family 79 protein [Rhodofomes roseus]